MMTMKTNAAALALALLIPPVLGSQEVVPGFDELFAH